MTNIDACNMVRSQVPQLNSLNRKKQRAIRQICLLYARNNANSARIQMAKRRGYTRIDNLISRSIIIQGMLQMYIAYVLRLVQQAELLQ